ncbi:MAG: DUF2878 domain-containing protein [Desulfuromonadales bacterium]|nr:DUF2878 domain-containing protein [Desulfuromonadales bacterium]
MSPRTSKLINILMYQLGWFSCVLGAAWGYPLRGALGALLLLVLHLLLAESRRAELRLMLCACLLGVAVDTTQQALGIFTFMGDPVWPLWLPLWVFVIWMQFATLFHYALSWLAGHYLLAALFGLIGGPLAYWGGVRLGAASFADSLLLSLSSLALVWALVTPLMLWLSKWAGGSQGRYRPIFVSRRMPDDS